MEESDFPPGRRFLVKGFDLPVSLSPEYVATNWWGGTPEVMDDEWLRHAIFISNEGLDPVSFEEFLKVVDASRPASSSNS
jgi:hypothetical protein